MGNARAVLTDEAEPQTWRCLTQRSPRAQGRQMNHFCLGVLGVLGVRTPVPPPRQDLTWLQRVSKFEDPSVGVRTLAVLVFLCFPGVAWAATPRQPDRPFQQDVSPWKGRALGSSWGRISQAGTATTASLAVTRNPDGSIVLSGKAEWLASEARASVSVKGPELDIPLSLNRLPRGTEAISFPLSLTAGTPNFFFELVDTQDRAHRSITFRRHRNDPDRTRYTLLFADLEPPLRSGEAKLSKLRICFTNAPNPKSVALALGPVLAARGWPSTPPPACPWEPSRAFAGVAFSGRQTNYTHADTWYPAWAADGNLYSPYTDGQVGGVESISDGTWKKQGTQNATTGQAVIRGGDPLNLTVESLGVCKGDSAPYPARYPCGSLIRDGIWYYGTYCLGPQPKVYRDGLEYNWAWLGPFVGFRWSTDLGRTWTDGPRTPAKPIFGEHALNGEPVRIGSPHFVDFGRNMEHSPDGKAYLVAHGASRGPAGRRLAYNSWITGDEIYLVRVRPSPETINDPAAYEFFAGHDAAGQPRWAADFAQIQPLLRWEDHLGCVTATYDPALKKYLMCVTDGHTTGSAYDTSILEADALTGPWRLISYLEAFGRNAYFCNIPSKFVSPDGTRMWLCYSATFTGHTGNPKGGRYALCLREFRLVPLNQALSRASATGRSRW